MAVRYSAETMPKGLLRFQQSRNFHFITLSCYHRQPFLDCASRRQCFEEELERVRRGYGFVVSGYVVMPEHVHLVLSEPKHRNLAVVMQVLKQRTSRRLKTGSALAFWQRRYFDFNLRSEEKHREKVNYIHRNPVMRGLVPRPEEWPWSSFQHYAAGITGIVEIESEWTTQGREKNPTLSCAKDGAPQGS